MYTLDRQTNTTSAGVGGGAGGGLQYFWWKRLNFPELRIPLADLCTCRWVRSILRNVLYNWLNDQAFVFWEETLHLDSSYVWCILYVQYRMYIRYMLYSIIHICTNIGPSKYSLCLQLQVEMEVFFKIYTCQLKCLIFWTIASYCHLQMLKKCELLFCSYLKPKKTEARKPQYVET